MTFKRDIDSEKMNQQNEIIQFTSYFLNKQTQYSRTIAVKCMVGIITDQTLDLYNIPVN